MIRQTLMLSCCLSCVVLAGDYDPLAKSKSTDETLLLDVLDKSRDRKIPIKVYLPASKEPAPLILLSHGLGGSRETGPHFGKHWSARGYIVVAIQHPGSDESVWKDAPLLKRMGEMKQAASGPNLILRLKDVPAVIDQLLEWNKSSDHKLAKRINPDQIGMSGHSFGAITTQGVSGQTIPLTKSTEPRIKAAYMMSPSSPRRNVRAVNSFGDVKIPWLLVTGTQDTSPINDTTVENRLAVYSALPPGDKYELVLEDANHMAVGGGPSKNANHQKALLAISTAFWDAYLKQDKQAKEWLTGDAVKKVLDKEDRWQKK